MTVRDIGSQNSLALAFVPEQRAIADPVFSHDLAVVGLGYVGLPTALAFHAAGMRVVGVDVNPGRLADIRRERVDLLAADRARLAAALTSEAFMLTGHVGALSRAAAVLVCVPTPVDAHHVPDLAMLTDACRTVVEHAVPGQALILTSTSYVGCTAELLAGPLVRRGLVPGEHLAVAFSPERIDPANTAFPQSSVPRVVGGVTANCTQQAMKVLGGYGASLHAVSSSEAAELTKLLENTFRAVNIALINEVADASRALGVDIREVIEAAATKPYGYMPFLPGPGVGGHCIPCDPHYLVWQLRRHRVPTPVIDQAMTAIAARPGRVVDRVREALSDAGRGVTGARVLVLGVAYKPNVEDVRESPALEILAGLRAAGADVSYHDPLVEQVRLSDGAVLRSGPVPAAEPVDLVLLHTLHSELDLGWLQDGPLLLDATYRLTRFPDRVVL